MPTTTKPWPAGLELKSEQFSSLEEELIHSIKIQGGIVNSEFITFFLRNIFSKEDVTIERRSFMRYLVKDPRFNFEGTTRARTVEIVDPEKLDDIEGWVEISESIIEFLIHETNNSNFDEISLPDILRHLRNEFFHLNHDGDNSAFHYAIDVLHKEKRIKIDDYNVSWGPRNFIGFTPNSETTGGLKLPMRSWRLAKKIRDKLAVDRMEKWKSHFDMHGNSTNSNEKSEWQNPILDLAFSRGPELSASEIIEVALEVLYSKINFEDTN